MLTVKHIPYRGPGHLPATYEFVVEAHHVELRENDNGVQLVLAYNEPRYVVGEFDGGVVYVMNDQGQTVTSYDLGDPRKG